MRYWAAGAGAFANLPLIRRRVFASCLRLVVLGFRACLRKWEATNPGLCVCSLRDTLGLGVMLLWGSSNRRARVIACATGVLTPCRRWYCPASSARSHT